MSKADSVRRLAADGIVAEVIAVRLSMELYEVRDVLAAPTPKRKGRPPSAGRCKHCGASPAHQRH